MSKRLAVVMLLSVMVTLAVSVAGCGNLPKDAVAKVGDAFITEEDFNLRVSQSAAQNGITKEDYPDYYKQIEQQVLGIMVETQLAAIKAQELGITVTDDDVQAEIDNIVTTYYNDDPAGLDADLATANISMEQFRQEYWDYLISLKVYDEVTKDVPAPTDEEVAAYYEANKDSYAVPESRTVRHILIMPGQTAADSTTSTSEGESTTTTSITDADWAAALAKANEVRGKLVAGGDWTTLAAQYSDDTYSKDSGGELGDVTKGQMVQEFEDAVFSLAVDEISQPVKTIYGYHIIQVTAITEAGQQTLDEVKDSISADLLDEAKYQAWLAWVDDMKTKVTIIYRSDLAPTTTTTAAPATDETTATTAGQTITTAAPDTTTSQP